MRSAVWLAVIASACSSRTTDVQHAELGALRFDVPADWKRADTKAPGMVTSVWTPRENNHKESISVIRSDGREALARAGEPALERLLVAAQASLPHARASNIAPITSARGLSGVRLEVDFVPQGSTASYHRVHAVLVDGSTLVNVMYTAKDADSDAFNLVLSSIRHEEG